MANIKDVAKLSGVSISTVSRVVNNSASVAKEKSDAVLRAMRELNYQPNTFAKALVSNRSDTVGVLIGQFSSPFFGELLAGVEAITQQHSKQLMISAGHRNIDTERDAIQTMTNRRCDALIIHSEALSDLQLMELVHRHPATVIVNRSIADIRHQCVFITESEMDRAAMQFLKEKGHHEIALLLTEASPFNEQALQKAHQEALINQGVMPDLRLTHSSEDTIDAGYQSTLRLLDSPIHFTAIIAYSEKLLTGAMKALKERKVRVPGDISVLGVSYSATQHTLCPEVTLFEYPTKSMAEQATRMALSLLESSEPNHANRRFEPKLHRGQTVDQRR